MRKRNTNNTNITTEAACEPPRSHAAADAAGRTAANLPLRLTWRQLTWGQERLVARLDKYLRERDWPFVDARQAAKATFTVVKVRTFDFLIFASDGPNLVAMVVASRPTPAQVKTLTEWAQVFGAGFLAAFVFHAADAWWLLPLSDFSRRAPLASARRLEEFLGLDVGNLDGVSDGKIMKKD